MINGRAKSRADQEKWKERVAKVEERNWLARNQKGKS